MAKGAGLARCWADRTVSVSTSCVKGIRSKAGTFLNGDLWQAGRDKGDKCHHCLLAAQ